MKTARECGACITIIGLMAIFPMLGRGEAAERTEHNLAETDPTTTIGRLASFQTDSFSQSNVDVSSDGQDIYFDHLGALYKTQLKGGLARPIFANDSWSTQPKLSPDGKQLAFRSDFGGYPGVSISNTEGQSVHNYILPDPKLRVVEFWWHPGGGVFLEAQNSMENRTFWVLANERQPEQLPAEQLDGLQSRGKWDRNGQNYYYGGDGIFRKNAPSGRITQLASGDEKRYDYFFKLRLSPDGSVLAYFRRFQTKDGGFDCTLGALDASSGRELPIKVWSGKCTNGVERDFDVPSFALLPKGDEIVINVNGKISRQRLVDGTKSVIPITVPVTRSMAMPIAQRKWENEDGIVKSRVIRWPSLVGASSTLVVNAFAQLYAKKLGDDNFHRLTKGSSQENSPAVSPDGKWVAYTTWNDKNLGQIMIVPTSGGASTQVTRHPGRYVNPTWSSDGSKIAYIEDEDARTREGLPPSAGLEPKYPYRGPLKLKWLQRIAQGNWGAETDVLSLKEMRFTRRFYPVPMFLPGDQRLAVIGIEYEDNNSSSPSLLSIDLATRSVKHHLQIPVSDELIISPDAMHLAIVRHGRLHIESIGNLDGDEKRKLTIEDKNFVEGIDPVYVSWSDSDNLLWAEGNEIYRYSIATQSRERVSAVNIERPLDRPDGCIAFTNARLVTMTGNKVIERGFIDVCKDRIVGVGEMASLKLAKGTRIVNVNGATIIPGLADMHGHLHNYDFEVWPDQDLAYVGMLAHGVTTVYDPQTHMLDPFGRQERIDVGDAVGPRIYASGPAIMGENNRELHTHLGPPIENLDDARALVKARSRYGAGPLKSYDDTSRSRRKLLAEAAREEGISVTNHPRDFEAAISSVSDGMLVEHALEAEIDLYDDMFDYLALSGVSVNYEFMGSGRYPIDVTDEKLNRFNSKTMLERNARKDSYIFRQKESVARQATRLAQRGGIVTIGAHGNGVAGLATHQEMWALVDQGGMSPYEALRVASLNGAKKIGMEKWLGSLAEGKLADFIVLNSNPLDRIQNSIDIRYVVKGGLVYDGPTATRLWPNYRPLSSWRWQGPQVHTQNSPAREPGLPITH